MGCGTVHERDSSLQPGAGAGPIFSPAQGSELVRPGYQSALYDLAMMDQVHETCQKADSHRHHIGDTGVDKDAQLVGSLDEADQG